MNAGRRVRQHTGSGPRILINDVGSSQCDRLRLVPRLRRDSEDAEIVPSPHAGRRTA